MNKKTGGLSIFALWFGAAVSLAEIMTGSLIAPLGVARGIAVIILGHLIGCLILAAVGIIGFREKKPSQVAIRTSMGEYGSYMVSVFNIIQLTGWTAIMLIQAARAMQSLAGDLFNINSFAVFVVFVGILVALWAVCTEKGISLINNAAVLLLIVLSFVMLGSVLKSGQPGPVTGSISFGMALELSIIMPLSWLPLISDYTMSAKTARGSFAGSFTGYFLGSSFMYIIGLVAAVHSGTSDPIAILLGLSMVYPALLIVILATVTTTFLDVYSASMSTVNLAPKLSKKLLIVLYTAVGALLALFFPMEQYENFLYLIGSLFAPAFSVILFDYFIYKKDWSEERFNTIGIIAAMAGTAAYNIISGYDLALGSSLPTIIFTIVVYMVMRKTANILRKGDCKHAG
ncbi:MAG: putative hydroxymethylpyrimidine transporter CytX [Actinobacteria bacterium]|nr:putative hydroxymethylpyrimidine transporter CytX [Actinomycetota bacterium]